MVQAVSKRRPLCFLPPKRAGVNLIIATPHIRENSLDSKLIYPKFKEALEMAKKAQITLLAGAEVFHFAAMAMGRQTLLAHCIQGTNVLLLEFDRDTLPPDLETLIMHIQRQGINLIIAHPERYEAIQRNPAICRLLVRLGCELQLDAQSLNEGPFSKARRCALTILNMGLAHHLSSDAHSIQDYGVFQRIYRKYAGKLKKTLLLKELTEKRL